MVYRFTEISEITSTTLHFGRYLYTIGIHSSPRSQMSSKSFPLNAWYAVAWSHEVKHELAARTLCDRDVVLYRRLDGELAVLEDACWHRLLPLSMGSLQGDQVACGYHGLVFNAAGRCTYMPAQETINPSACVRAFPVLERHRLVWVWPGDPALADPGKMPDSTGMTAATGLARAAPITASNATTDW
jgi:phenylpropionate dioxygenase-like ring-hydroxylating dioxygenase large terminal subunit